MIKRTMSTMSNYPITITDLAWDKIIKISQIENVKRFIFSAKGGGCNGFNYKLDILNENDYKNLHENLHKNLHKKISILKKNNTEVLIDPTTEFLLFGTTIDYIYDNFSNKFMFIPDNTKATSCGCGISFNPKG